MPLQTQKEHNGLIRYYRPRKNYPTVVNVPKLLLKIKSTFNNDYGMENEESILRGIGEVSVLLLDDIGAEKSTEWVKETLYLIIDQRYCDMKKTYFTSNLTLKEISKIDDRISSRIAEMAKTLTMQGKDRRL